MNEYIFFVALLAILFVWSIDKHIQGRETKQERNEWKLERQMLLDRIQAPTFAEYVNKIVREKKIEQPQEEEKPIEFL